MRKALLSLVLLTATTSWFGNDVLIQLEDEQPSTIVNVNGVDEVRNAKRLPSGGNNFESYSRVLSTIGRTHVHGQLRPVVVEAYQSLETSAAGVKWVYAESGWKDGARFWPHRTHRDGLSIDFIVPVVDRETRAPDTLFLWPLNGYGYKARFDGEGIYESYQIDFHAMILHLKALQDASARHGLFIKRVIFDPPLLALLRKEADFRLIAGIPFMSGAAWFPHDSHYHVDFGLTEKK